MNELIKNTTIKVEEKSSPALNAQKQLPEKITDELHEKVQDSNINNNDKKTDKEILLKILESLEAAKIDGIEKVKSKFDAFTEDEIYKILIVLDELKLMKEEITDADLNLTSEKSKKMISRLQIINSNILTGLRGGVWYTTHYVCD